jgi:FkbM family methyltransferase
MVKNLACFHHAGLFAILGRQGQSMWLECQALITKREITMKNAPTDKQRHDLDIQPGKLKRFMRKLWWLLSVYVGPARFAEVLTANGVLRFWSKDKTTGRILHVYRNHEFDEIVEVAHKLSELGIRQEGRSNMLDVGGYIGMSSCAFLLEGFFEKSYAFEPSPKNFELMMQNANLNGLDDRLVGFNVALSDSDGSIQLELSEKNYGDNRVHHEDAEQGAESYGESEWKTVRIPAYSLDSFFAANPDVDPGSIGLVWMDIQGHEPRFFSGAQAFFAKNRGVPVFMEFWPYGMRRSGADMNMFLSICEKSFNYFIPWGSYGNEKKPISELRDFWKSLEQRLDETDEPGTGANILLF